VKETLIPPWVPLHPSETARSRRRARAETGTAEAERAAQPGKRATEIIARKDVIILRLKRPLFTIAELMARFDPAKRRHGAAFIRSRMAAHAHSGSARSLWLQSGQMSPIFPAGQDSSRSR
jgi:hypothetical protein